MNSARRDKILLILDFKETGGEAAREIIRRDPEADFTVIVPAGVSPQRTKDFHRHRIIHYRPEIPLTEKLLLIRRLRRAGFRRAIYVGDRFDLRGISLAWAAGSSETTILLNRDNFGQRRRVTFFSLLGAALGRGLIFAFSLPWLLAIRLLFWPEKYRKITPQPAPELPPLDAEPGISVVIPNYDGRELLEECLPSVVEAVTCYGRNSEIIVVDDGSTDDSVDYLRANFPGVKVIPLSRNFGFGAASERGIREARHRLVALLNSDISAEKDFLSPLVACFRQPGVFGVQPRAYTPDGKGLNFGLNVGRQEGGYIRMWNESDTDHEIRVDHLCPTLYCLGGAMLFDREKYYALDGFDPLFYPFRWEDIDLCYRALKRGWKLFYQPASTVYHKHHATLNRVFKPDYLNIIETKNELLFTWKNILDPAMIEEHVRLLPRYFFHQLLAGNYNFPWATFRALLQLPTCLKQRRVERRKSRRKDRQVLSKSLRIYLNYLKGDYSCGNHRRRILLLNSTFPYPPIDGGKARVFNMVKELSQDNDIHLLCYIEEAQKVHLPLLRDYCASVTTIDWPPPPSWLGWIKETPFPMYYRGYYSDEMKAALLKFLREKPVDLVQMETDKMLYYVRFVEDLPTVYVHQDVANLCLGAGKDPPQRGWRKIVGFYEWMRTLRWEASWGGRYHKVVTLSREDGEILSTLVPEANLGVVRHCTDVSYFDRDYRKIDEPVLIYIGSFIHYPNVEAARYLCREIFPRIKNSIPSARLLMIGSHPTPEINNLGCQPGIEVLGFVDDVRQYLDQAMIFLAPVRKGLGVKGKILEAMVRGKPVVTTSIGIRGAEVVAGRDLLVADTPQAFASAVVDLISDPARREKLARAGQKLVRENYDWSFSARQMNMIYQEILGDEK